MAKSFNLKFLGPETEGVLKSLARLTNSSIKIEEAITVTVESDELAPIVERVLGIQTVDPTGPGMDYEAMAPRVARTFEVREAEQRNCQACGQPLEPNAAPNAKFCMRPECKKAHWREKYRQTKALKNITPAGKMEEVGAETEGPLAEIHWTIETGDWKGKILSPGQLANWLKAGSLVEGTRLIHSTRGIYVLGKRKGRAGLIPIPLGSEDGMPGLEAPAPGAELENL